MHVLCKLELTQPCFTDRVSLVRNVGFMHNFLHLIRRILFVKLGGGRAEVRGMKETELFSISSKNLSLSQCFSLVRVHLRSIRISVSV